MTSSGLSSHRALRAALAAIALTAPALAQVTVLKVDSSGNVTANASLNAQAGVGGGTYTSGVTATGATSDTCILTFTNGGGTSGTASIALNGSGVFPAQSLVIVSTGFGYTSPPNAASVADGTATMCTGTPVFSTYLNGVVNMLATSKPGTPPAGNGSVWFESASAGDWPLAVPMGIDSTGSYISAMVRMNEGSSTGPYYWGVGGVLPTATWMVEDTNSGVTSEVIQGGSSQGTNSIWAVENNAGNPLWTIAEGGDLSGHNTSGDVVSLRIPTSIFTTYVLELPIGAGSSGQVLTSAGAGNPMAWNTLSASQLPNNAFMTWFGSNGANATVTSGIPQYLAAGFSGSGTNLGTRTWVSPVNCTLRGFYVYTLNGNSGGTLQLTIYDHGNTPAMIGTATTQTVSFMTVGAGGVQTTGAAAPVSAGDTLTVEATMSAGTSAEIGPWGVACEPN